MSIENRQFELFSPDPVGGSSSGGGEGQKPADFSQAAGAPDWGASGETAGWVGTLTVVEHSQSNLFPKAPFIEPEQNSPDVLQSPRNDCKEARRAVWEAAGCVPPMAGGQERSSSANEPSKDVPDRETASRRIDEILSTKIPPKQSPEWREHRKRLLELNYLDSLYPGLFEEVYQSHVERIRNRKD